MVTITKIGEEYNSQILEISGLSTDPKPVDQIDGVSIANGSTFKEIDTGKEYTYNESAETWHINKSASSGGGSGVDGEDGGYYTPGVTQPTTDTMQISFAPSKPDMPAVNTVTVNLPVSENSGQNLNLTAEQEAALEGLLGVTAFTKSDVSVEVAAFREAFGLDSGDTPDQPAEPEQPAKTLTSISATYSGGAVPVGTVVTTLRVTVTAHYSDGTSAAVTGYTLSGVIAEGDNIITVTYQGQTATITVVGTADAEDPEQPGGDEVFDSGLIDLTAQTVGDAGGATHQVLNKHTLVVTRPDTSSSCYSYILVNGLTPGATYDLYMEAYAESGTASVYGNKTANATDDSNYGSKIQSNTNLVMYNPLTFTLPSNEYGIIIYCYASVTKLRLVAAEG